MPPCTQFFQLTGLNAHSHAWDRFKPWKEGNDGLARAIAGPSSPLRFGEPPNTELILGIWENGASCLLLNLDYIRVFCNEMGLPIPHRAPCAPGEFLSLSPIKFHDATELLKKLKTYAQKVGKKGKVAEVGDTSQANKGYMRVYGSSVSGQPLPGIARSAFEHNRILYAILQQKIDPHKFGLPYFPWAAPSKGPAADGVRMRIVSIAYNTWAADERDRKLAHRLADPRVLDIGWSERYAPEGSTVHYKLEENKGYGQGYQPASFVHGETKILPRFEIANKLRTLFESFSSCAPAQPVMLLVHGAPMTYAVLKSCGVNLDACVVGIRDLLVQGPLTPIPQTPSKEEDEGTKSYTDNSIRRSVTLDYKDEDVKYRPQRNRSRSRSPTRGSRTLSPRRPSPPRRDLKSEPRNTSQHVVKNVYIVDVQELYQRLTQTDGSSSQRVSDTARALGINIADAGWCAGNESGTMFDIWTEMASGPPIDEQRAARLELGPLMMNAVVEDTPKPEQENDDDEDDEGDPNDVFITRPSISVGVGGKPSGDPYANFEDDEDDDWD